MRGVATESSNLPLTAALLASALVFGGGQGGPGDVATQLAAIVVLAWLWLHRAHRAGQPCWTWLPVVALLAVPLLQLLPLPMPAWSALGGRAVLAGELAAAGVVPAPRLGLDPTGSERAAVWLLPGIAMYLSALRLRTADQLRLLWLVLAFAAASVVLGLAQLAGGPSSALRFHEHTNANGMVGFFANRNHAASLLAAAVPLAMALAGREARRRAECRGSALRIAGALALVVLLMLGLWTTQSRAGLLIGIGVLALSLPLALVRGSARRRAVMAAGAGVLALLLALQLAATGWPQGGGDSLDGGRSRYVAVTMDAAAHYAPTGSGLGTFRQAYQPFERASGHGAGNVIVNHAHNDYLESWLEAGWLAVPCALILFATMALGALRAWREEGRVGPWRRAATLALLVPVLHSAFDYPLRTTSHIALSGLLLAVVVSAATHGPRHRGDVS